MKLRFFLLITFVLFGTLSLQAAGVAEEENSKELDKVTVILDWVVNTNHTGLYVAKDLGFFDEEGLDVSIEFPPETGAVGLVLSGKAEFAVSYQEQITYARVTGTPLKAIATILQHNTSGFASPAEKGIVTPEDFVGRTYGGWGSPMEDAMLSALMGLSGNSLEDVTSISIGSMDFFAATSGDIDFTWIFEGWDGIAAEQKSIPINFIRLSDIDSALDYYTPVLAATDSYIEENAETVEKFLRAVSKGYLYAVENPLEAAEILLANAPELDATFIQASQKYLAAQYVADAEAWGYMQESVWESFAVWMKERGLLDGNFIAQEAYTNEYLP